MKGLTDMLEKAQEMQARISEMQSKLAEVEIEGESGGGLVKVVLNGKGDMRALRIDPSLYAADEREVLEDLIVAAHSDAKAKVEAHVAKSMSELTGGLALPPGFKLPI